jgi:hypothetical protein
MKYGDMVWIHYILEVLQPVARHECGTTTPDARVIRFDTFARLERLKYVVLRKHGLPVGRSKIGENETITLG